jgi:asparagine synthase (glutamine-hydrolysing)
VSGIAGIIRFDGGPVEPDLVETMTSAMAYRGPDGIHHWARGSVALGQCMLRTTTESLEETQPLTNEDESLVLVMDGRVDNWVELRLELLGRGAVLRDRSDAELVLRAYEAWGREFLARVDGDFALVIWDSRTRTAFCARDRVGNKPFHYLWDGATFVFASDLHAILGLPWVKQELNEGILAEFLSGEWYSREETFWKGILRLVAAHRMEVGPGGPRPEKYWQPDFDQSLPFCRDEEYIEAYRELFSDTVRRLSRSHRPAGFEVSGGLDSSAVFCVAEGLRRSGSLPAPAIEGYTLAFPDDEEANELEYVRAVGGMLGLEIGEVPPTQMPLAWYREEAAFFRDFPGYPNGTMSLGLRRLAREDGCRVLLGGGGGDEWLGGSGQRVYYTEELAAGRWRNAGACLRQDLAEIGVAETGAALFRSGVFPLLPASAQRAARYVRGKALRRGRQPGAVGAGWLAEPLREALLERRRASEAEARLEWPAPGRRCLQRRLADAYNALSKELEERAASRVRLELRHPMNAPRLVEFAFATPERLRQRGRVSKYVHVEAMKGILPEQVRTRRTKANFSVVFRRQLDGEAMARLREIPAKRPSWVLTERAEAAIGSYEGTAGAGRPGGGAGIQWLLWNLLACDQLFGAVDSKV